MSCVAGHVLVSLWHISHLLSSVTSWFYIFVIPFFVSAFWPFSQAVSRLTHTSQDQQQHHDAPDPGLRRRDSPTPVTYASVVSVSHVAVRCWTLWRQCVGVRSTKASGPLSPQPTSQRSCRWPECDRSPGALIRVRLLLDGACTLRRPSEEAALLTHGHAARVGTIGRAGVVVVGRWPSPPQ